MQCKSSRLKKVFHSFLWQDRLCCNKWEGHVCRGLGMHWCLWAQFVAVINWCRITHTLACPLTCTSFHYWLGYDAVHKHFYTYFQFSLVFFTFQLTLWQVLWGFFLHELHTFTFKGFHLTLMKKFSHFAFSTELQLPIPEKADGNAMKNSEKLNNQLQPVSQSVPHCVMAFRKETVVELSRQSAVSG